METFIRVWKGLMKVGRCRRCRGRILWVTTDQGKQLPFDGRVQPLRVDVHPVTLARFEVYEASTAFHAKYCPGTKRRVDRVPTSSQQ